MWSFYGNLDRLERECNKTMLLKFSLFNQIDDPSTHVAISACTADFASSDINVRSEPSATCFGDGVQETEITAPVQLASSGASSSERVVDVIDALAQLRDYSAQAVTACNETIIYAYNGHVALGIYAGSGLGSQGTLTSILEKLTTQVVSDGSIPENLAVQLCGSYSARYSLGVMVNTAGDLGAVQKDVQSWKNGSCAELGTPVDWQTQTYSVPSLLELPSDTPAVNITDLINSTRLASAGTSSHLTRRTGCSTVQATGGDTCETLAAQCGITIAISR